MASILQDAALAPSVRERARAVALDLGDRLYQTAYRENPPDEDWAPTRSFAGTAGYALTFMALAASTGEGRYEAAMHEFLRRSARVVDLPEIGLFGGISGLRAVTALAMRLEPRYEALLAQCEAYIDAHLPQTHKAPKSFGEFDLMSGWAGIRLGRCIEGPSGPDASVEALAWILEDERRWCCVHPVRGGQAENDLGLAHGLPGMLAALALTLEEPGDLREVLARNANALASRALRRDDVVWWPYAAGPIERPRAAWCYGTPGVAAALYSVARFLGENALADFAVTALESLERVDDAACLIDEANLCHGRIGNALAVASVAARRDSAALRRLVERYTLAGLDDIEADGGLCMSRQDDGHKYDTFNELTGSAGVILGLLTLAGEFDGAWMRAHALHPLS
jgi:lantibiotic biosynthesis protein